jgi:hypothetical protein
VRLLLEAGPLALMLDTSPRPSLPSIGQTSPSNGPSPTPRPAPVRTEQDGPEGEMWVVSREAVESWLRHLAVDCDECTERVAELMIELDLQDAESYGGAA